MGNSGAPKCCLPNEGNLLLDLLCSSTTTRRFSPNQALYLEDLFVIPEARNSGVGLALLESVARVAADRGCGRVEWAVLDWNRPAIDFYRRFGAAPMDEWTVFRLTGDALGRYASR